MVGKVLKIETSPPFFAMRPHLSFTMAPLTASLIVSGAEHFLRWAAAKEMQRDRKRTHSSSLCIPLAATCLDTPLLPTTQSCSHPTAWLERRACLGSEHFLRLTAARSRQCRRHSGLQKVSFLDMLLKYGGLGAPPIVTS